MNSFSKQRTLAMMTGFERYTKKTRRAMFLEEMEQVVPWEKLCGLIEAHYPKPGNGRRPKELEQMLRIYFVQQWFNLADPAVEEALYDSATLRQFVGIDLGAEPVPDVGVPLLQNPRYERPQSGEYGRRRGVVLSPKRERRLGGSGASWP
jgi:IS5 family transposase